MLSPALTGPGVIRNSVMSLLNRSTLDAMSLNTELLLANVWSHSITRTSSSNCDAETVVATLAALFPLPLDRIADPLVQPDPAIRALWILKPAILLGSILVRPALTAGLIAFLAVLFVLLPILDRSGHSTLKRRAMVAIPFLLWMAFLGLSLLMSVGVSG